MNIIASNGAIVTEYAPGTPPIGSNFPVRNRIISGMCNGTLVVEADMRSGAMITAKTAISQGRQLFAIPGNLGENNSEGTNKLIRDGAIMVIETEDILHEYEYLYGNYIDNLRMQYARANYLFGEKKLIDMGISTRVADVKIKSKSNKTIERKLFDKKEIKKADNIVVDKKISDKKISNRKEEINKETLNDSEALLASLDPKQWEMFEHLPYLCIPFIAQK